MFDCKVSAEAKARRSQQLCVRCRCEELALCVCVHMFVSVFAVLLCCGRCLWAPGSQMKAVSHVAASVELLSQRAATNQCFLLLGWRDSLPLTLRPAAMLAFICRVQPELTLAFLLYYM